jgi:hypothetical protein
VVVIVIVIIIHLPGITLSSVHTRRAPHVLNLLHQLAMAEKSMSESEALDSMDRWSGSSATLARALNVGRFEAQSAKQLRAATPAMSDLLRRHTQEFGLQKFITHQALASPCYVSNLQGCPPAWQAVLESELGAKSQTLLAERSELNDGMRRS